MTNQDKLKLWNCSVVLNPHNGCYRVATNDGNWGWSYIRKAWVHYTDSVYAGCGFERSDAPLASDTFPLCPPPSLNEVVVAVSPAMEEIKKQVAELKERLAVLERLSVPVVWETFCVNYSQPAKKSIYELWTRMQKERPKAVEAIQKMYSKGDPHYWKTNLTVDGSGQFFRWGDPGPFLKDSIAAAMIFSGLYRLSPAGTNLAPVDDEPGDDEFECARNMMLWFLNDLDFGTVKG
jgi:hypothetical protein